MKTICKLDLKGRDLSMTVPSSKSLTNRALILAALAEGSSVLKGDFGAEDIQLMVAALRVIGVSIDDIDGGLEVSSDGSWLQRGDDVELFLGNSGTSVRFLTSVLSLRKGITIITGKERMYERPIADLVDALRSIGADIEYVEKDGFPPLRISSTGRLRGGNVVVKGSASSQFVSSLLMIAPLCEMGLELEVSERLISKPYVDLSTNLMGKFGAGVKEWDPMRYTVSPGSYTGQQYEVEADASAAGYWFALAALQRCRVSVEGLDTMSLQGDAFLFNHLETMGCRWGMGKNSLWVKGPAWWSGLSGVTVSMNDMPDMVMTLAMVAVFAKGVTRINDVGSLRVKETDRLAALACELGKCGVKVEAGDDWIEIHGDRNFSIESPVEIECYDDHRIAMSFAILGTRTGNIVIKDLDCVKKSYPGFWQHLDGLSV